MTARSGAVPGAKRTFVALVPPPPILATLGDLRRRLEPELPGLRWTRSPNLHLTLRFFGALGPEARRAAGDALSQVVGGIRPFSLTLSGIGTFPGWSAPRVLWVGATEGRQTLLALSRTLERAFEARGLGRADKPFRPHLTLGRWKDGDPLEIARARAATERIGTVGTFEVSALHLVTSRLDPGGAVYLREIEARFGGTR